MQVDRRFNDARCKALALIWRDAKIAFCGVTCVSAAGAEHVVRCFVLLYPWTLRHDPVHATLSDEICC